MDVEDANDSQEDFLLKGGIITVQNRRRAFPSFRTHTKVILCATIPAALFVIGIAIAELLSPSRLDTNLKILPPLLFPLNPEVYTKGNATTIGNTTEVSENEVPTNIRGVLEPSNNEHSQNSRIPYSTKDEYNKYKHLSGFQEFTTSSPEPTTESNQKDQTQNSTIELAPTAGNTEFEKPPSLEDSSELVDSTEAKDMSVEFCYPVPVHDDVLTTTPSPGLTTEGTQDNQTLQAAKTTTEKIERELLPTLDEFKDTITTPSPVTTTVLPQSDQTKESATTKTTLFDVLPEFEESTYPSTTNSLATTTTERPYQKTTTSAGHHKHHKLRARPIHNGVAEYFYRVHTTQTPRQEYTTTKYKSTAMPITIAPSPAKPSTNKNDISLFDIPYER